VEVWHPAAGRIGDQRLTAEFLPAHSLSAGAWRRNWTPNNKPVLDGSGQQVAGDISSIESYRRTLLFQQLGYSAAQIRQLEAALHSSASTPATL